MKGWMDLVAFWKVLVLFWGFFFIFFGTFSVWTTITSFLAEPRKVISRTWNGEISVKFVDREGLRGYVLTFFGGQRLEALCSHWISHHSFLRKVCMFDDALFNLHHLLRSVYFLHAFFRKPQLPKTPLQFLKRSTALKTPSPVSSSDTQRIVKIAFSKCLLASPR